MTRRAVAYVVKVTVKRDGQDVHLYLSKQAAQDTGRPWTTRQGNALRFDKADIREAIRRSEIPLGAAKEINLRVVPILRVRAPQRHLARIQYAA